MTRRAPAVGRSIDILELLADRPSEALTLSEIARLLQLNKASCHTILVALTDRHYLTKDERDKTYRLGPAVLTLAGSLLSRDDAANGERDAAARAEDGDDRGLGLGAGAAALVAGDPGGAGHAH